MEAFQLNSRELVERIWREVAEEQVARPGGQPAPAPEFERLVENDERRYLNAHCVLDRSPVRPGGRGVLSRAKARVAWFVIRSLDRYLDDEQEFLAHLVRLQNKLTVEHDRLADEVVAIRRFVADETERIAAATRHLHVAVEQRLTALEQRVDAAPGLGSELP